MLKLYGQFSDQKCTKTHLQRCRNSKIFRGRYPRAPAPQGKLCLTQPRRGASNAGGGRGEEGERKECVGNAAE